MDGGKRAWIWGGIAVGAGIGLVVALGGDKTAALGSSRRILLVGDDLALGLKTPLGVLADAAHMAFRVDGRTATTITAWAKFGWLAADVQAFSPDLVLVSLGTYDMRMADPASELDDFNALVQAVQASGAALVWIAPPTMPFENGAVRSLVGRAPAVFPSSELDIPRGPDTVHPTAKGYAGWAGAIWSWLGGPGVV